MMDALVATYYLNQKWSDVSIVIKDTNKTLPAHKFVLLARSEVFGAMLGNNVMAEGKSSVITLNTYSEGAIKILLEHIYTFKCNIDGDTVMEVLDLSKQYQFPKLTEACLEFLNSELDSSNVLAVYQSTYNSDMKAINKQCVHIISAETSSVINSPQFISLPETFLVSILKMDNLSCDEIDIFKACIKWAETRTSCGISVAKAMEPIVPFIRFPSMTIRQISMEVAPLNVLPQKDLLEVLLYLGSDKENGFSRFPKEPRIAALTTLDTIKSKILPINISNDKIISTTVQLPAGLHVFNGTLTIGPGGILTCAKWDGSSGGFLYIRARKLIIQKDGQIHVNGNGYRGGAINPKHSYPDTAFQGESFAGIGAQCTSNNTSGGGAGETSGSYGSKGGGGGGYGSNGENAEPNTYSGNNYPGGSGGVSYGSNTLDVLYLGSGGGGGTIYSFYTGNPCGGAGGGILIIEVINFDNDGLVTSDGDNGGDGSAQYSSGGGGGSGGSIYITSNQFRNTGKICARGGAGGSCNIGSCHGIASTGGRGGVGRIRIDGVQQKSIGEVNPAPQLNLSSKVVLFSKKL